MDRGHQGQDLSRLREEYQQGGLAEADLAPDPMTMFDRWFGEAEDAGVYAPNAMVLSTVAADGQPSSRTVLVQGYDEDGLRFYTNYESHKGAELAANPGCALLFPWYPLQRQVRIEGRVTTLSPEKSDAYFAGRPRGSQLGAWASPQSQEVAGREALDAAYEEAERRFEGAEVPRPPHWGGYLVRPESVEFWQGRPGRMHDRLVYRRDPSGEPAGAAGAGWRVVRLGP